MPLTAAEAAKPPTGKVVVWSWNIAAKALKDLIPSFEKRYPGVHVTVDMTGAKMQTRFMLSLAADVGAPEISQLQLSDAPHYMATGKLADLTAVAAQYSNDFPASRWEDCEVNGHVFAIPWDLGPCAVFYKRDLFKKYGIDPSSIHTWADYIQAGKVILQKSGGQTKMLPLGMMDLSTMFKLLLQQTKGQVFDTQGRVAVDSPQAQQALDIIRELRSAGICSDIAAYSPEWEAGFLDNSIASYPGAVWLGGLIKDAEKKYPGPKPKWGVFELPAVQRGGLHVANLGGSVLVIPAQCRQKAAAWAFVKYALCTEHGQLEQYQKESLYPSFIPALKSHVMDKPDSFFGGQPVGRLFATNATKIWGLHLTTNWSEAWDYIQQDLSHWAATGMPHHHLLRSLAISLYQRLQVPLSPSLQSAHSQVTQMAATKYMPETRLR